MWKTVCFIWMITRNLPQTNEELTTHIFLFQIGNDIIIIDVMNGE